MIKSNNLYLNTFYNDNNSIIFITSINLNTVIFSILKLKIKHKIIIKFLIKKSKS